MTGDPPPTRGQATAEGQFPAEGMAVDVALGDGDDLGARVIEFARGYAIPIHENPDLVRLLAQMPPASAIPAELYRAVGEVLAFLARAGRPQAGLGRDP